MNEWKELTISEDIVKESQPLANEEMPSEKIAETVFGITDREVEISLQYPKTVGFIMDWISFQIKSDVGKSYENERLAQTLITSDRIKENSIYKNSSLVTQIQQSLFPLRSLKIELSSHVPGKRALRTNGDLVRALIRVSLTRIHKSLKINDKDIPIKKEIPQIADWDKEGYEYDYDPDITEEENAEEELAWNAVDAGYQPDPDLTEEENEINRQKWNDENVYDLKSKKDSPDAPKKNIPKKDNLTNAIPKIDKKEVKKIQKEVKKRQDDTKAKNYLDDITTKVWNRLVDENMINTRQLKDKKANKKFQKNLKGYIDRVMRSEGTLKEEDFIQQFKKYPNDLMRMYY